MTQSTINQSLLYYLGGQNVTEYIAGNIKTQIKNIHKAYRDCPHLQK